MEIYKKTINGIEVNYIQVKKHKHIVIAYNFISLYNYESFNERNMLNEILENNMQKYPTKTKVNLHLDMLYGATFKSELYSRGNIISNNFYLKFINKKYLKNQPNLTESAFQFLNELVFNPRKYNNYLTQKATNKQIIEAKDILKTYEQDKPTYAYINFKRAILKENIQRLKIFPLEEKLSQVTKYSLTDTYNKMLKEDQLKIFVIGDFDKLEVENIIQRNFSKKLNNNILENINLNFSLRKTSKINEIIESDDLSISRIYLGYLLNIKFNSKLYFAMNILNIIIGGNSKSRLFSVIREKLNLVYYVYSSYNHDSGIFYINFECEPLDEDRAINEIKKVIDNIKAGKIEETEIKRAKEYLIKQYKSRADNLVGLLNLHILADIEENQPFDLTKTINNYSNITKKDLLDASKLLVLDTIYRYTKKEQTK
ncbi:MAG: M16 family metallopeptidase [Bacillota bacterium]